MSSTITSEAPTTVDVEREQPRLLVAPPVAQGIAALLLGLGVLGAGAALTPVSTAPTYAARLVAAPHGVAVAAVRSGTIATVSVRDGDVIRAGDLILQLDPAAIAERGRRLRLEIEHVERELATHRRGTLAVPDFLEDGPRPATENADVTVTPDELTARRADLSARLAETDLDLLHTDIRAVSDGRITGVAWLVPGARIAAGSTIAAIEPATTRVTLEVTAPASVQAALAAAPATARVHPLTIAGAPAQSLVGEIAQRVSGGDAGLVRLTVTDLTGVLSRARRPGDTVAEVAFATGETRSVLALLAAPFGLRLPFLRNPD